jgi:hypothetical protein
LVLLDIYVNVSVPSHLMQNTVACITVARHRRRNMRLYNSRC